MHLDAQPPRRMTQAVADRLIQVFRQIGAIQRLQEEMLKRQVNEIIRRGTGLRIDQF